MMFWCACVFKHFISHFISYKYISIQEWDHIIIHETSFLIYFILSCIYYLLQQTSFYVSSLRYTHVWNAVDTQQISVERWHERNEEGRRKGERERGEGKKKGERKGG